MDPDQRRVPTEETAVDHALSPTQTTQEKERKPSLHRGSWFQKLFWGFFWKLLAVLLLVGMAVVLWFSLDLGQYWDVFWGRQEVLGARTQLLESLPQEDLITARGRFTYIFPFDFWDSNSFRLLRDHALGFGSPDQEEQISILTAIRDWARRNDLDLVQPVKYFLIRMEVELGLELDPQLFEVEYLEGEKILTLPEPGVLSYRILERDWRRDGFPDFELPIEEWRDLLVLLEPELLRRSVSEDLEDAARDGLETFLSTLLKEPDWIFEIGNPSSDTQQELLLSR